MKRQKEDNTVSVLQRALRHLKVPVTNTSVKETLKSHPDYPTFKSISDSLNGWNIDHYPLKYNQDEMSELVAPYIVHFNSGGGQIAFVTEINKENVTYYNSYNIKKVTGLGDFLDKCTGAVILLNPDDASGEKDYRQRRENELINSAVLPVIISSLCLYVISTVTGYFLNDVKVFDNTEFFLIPSKIMGILLSVLLVLHEFEIRSTLTDKLCHINKATNCTTVLNDKASRIFGWFGWADAGFIYFTGGLIFLLSSPDLYGFSTLSLLSVISLPYPVFSIYYQGFVLRKWCPLCLGVQSVLILEFLVLFPFLSKLSFSFTAFNGFIFSFLLTGIIFLLVKMYIKEKMLHEFHLSKLLGFKKNPEILRTLLFNQPHYEIPVSDSGLLFGNRDANLKITAFLSLNCSHCARAFSKLKEILKSCTTISINIILLSSDTKIIDTLYHLNRQNMEDETINMLDHWFNMDPYSRHKIADSFCIPEAINVSEEVINENNRLFKALKIIGTPTFFINGYLLPKQYDVDDLVLFRELIHINKEIINIKK